MFEQKHTANEDLINLIVNEVKKTIRLSGESHPDNRIPLGISNRHIHLTESTFKKLFGPTATFETMRPLYQPGEFASNHILTIVGPKMRPINGVRILGPLRNYDQVEISQTDAIVLGINPPVVNSGTLDQAAALTLIGPAGSVYLEKCAIVASRHIHMTSTDAARFGVKEGDYCKVRVGGVKSTLFEKVLVRVNDSWKLQIHLDTDDANAALAGPDTFVEFVGKMEA